MAFGDNLKRLRTNKEFTQEYLARYYALAAQRFLIMKKVKCNRQLKL